MAEQDLAIVGGFYVGCQIRIAEGDWRVAACKKPVEALVPVGEFSAIWVCEEHLQLFKGKSVDVA